MRGEFPEGGILSAGRPARRRPILAISAAFIGGIAAGLQWPWSGGSLPGFAAIILLTAGLAPLFRFSPVLLYILLALTGYLRASMSPPPSCVTPPPLLEMYAEADIHITSPPEALTGRHGVCHQCDAEIAVPYRGFLPIDRGRRLRVCFRHDGTAPIPEYGDRWRVSGALRGEPDAAFPPRLEADARSLRTGQSQGAAFIRWCLRQRNLCAERLGWGIGAEHPTETGVLHALMLGCRTGLPDLQRRDFRATGTLHIFAISGTHVGVMALLCIHILKMCGIIRARWTFLMAPLLILYVTATGMSSSAIRAGVMAIIFIAADLFERRPDTLSALALSALLITAWEPSQLRDRGFLLSFAAVLGLILLAPPIYRALRPSVATDPWQLQEDVPVRRWMRTAGRYLFGLVSASLAAWLATAPLCMAWFHLFSPIGLLVNLLVVPAAFVIMLTGFLALAVGFIHPLAAEIFNHANVVFIDILLWVIHQAAKVPWGYWVVRTPPWWWILLWYMLAAAVRVPRGRGWRVILVPAACLLLTVVWDRLDVTPCRVEAWNAGPSGTLAIILPRQETVLINTGDAWQTHRVARYLRESGIGRVRTLLLTQTSASHAGGAMSLLDEVHIDEVWMPAARNHTPAFRAFCHELHHRGIPVRVIQSGVSGEWACMIRWEILAGPDEGSVGVQFSIPGQPMRTIYRYGGEYTVGITNAWTRAPTQACADTIITTRPGLRLLATAEAPPREVVLCGHEEYNQPSAPLPPLPEGIVVRRPAIHGRLVLP